MVTAAPAPVRNGELPSVSVAGVAWPYDKIALVGAALVALAVALIVTGSGEVASWAGILAGVVALLATRAHYGAAATARAS